MTSPLSSVLSSTPRAARMLPVAVRVSGHRLSSSRRRGYGDRRLTEALLGKAGKLLVQIGANGAEDQQQQGEGSEVSAQNDSLLFWADGGLWRRWQLP
jgi:hypothetical protein